MSPLYFEAYNAVWILFIWADPGHSISYRGPAPREDSGQPAHPQYILQKTCT